MSKLKSKLLSKNSASVSLSDISKSGGILSAEFHVNKLKGKNPHILKNGKYIPALPSEIKGAEYYNDVQVLEINNLLYAQKEISAEIERIKKNDKYKTDEKVEDSNMSGRAKNVCFQLLQKNVYEKPMISEVANIPTRIWGKSRGMGAGTMKEIQAYIISKGFNLIEK